MRKLETGKDTKDSRDFTVSKRKPGPEVQLQLESESKPEPEPDSCIIFLHKTMHYVYNIVCRLIVILAK